MDRIDRSGLASPGSVRFQSGGNARAESPDGERVLLYEPQEALEEVLQNQEEISGQSGHEDCADRELQVPTSNGFVEVKIVNNQQSFVMRFFIVAAMFIVAAVFSSCSHDDGPNYNTDFVPSRTVMVYMVAESNMADYLNSDIKEMLNGLRQEEFYPNDRIVFYVDDLGLPRI